MRTFRFISAGALAVVSFLCIVAYSSCYPGEKCSYTCHNGGVCNSSSCACPLAYGGDHCDTRTILGTWYGRDYLSNMTDSTTQSITIAESATDPTKLIVTFTSGYTGAQTITDDVSSGPASVSYTQLITLGGATDTLTGTITLTSQASLTNTYKITDSHGTIIDDVIGKYKK